MSIFSFGRSPSGGNTQQQQEVFLNVYDLHENNDTFYPIGLGFYHSGVQIGRDEYTFASGAGIYKHDAKSAPSGVKLRESYSMGMYKGTSKAIDKIINDMKFEFQGTDYHVINKNCNAFADEFLKRLVGNGIPGYVNRMAYIGSYFSCFMPESLNQDPTQANNNNNNNSSSNSNGLYSDSQRSNKNPIYSSSNGNKLGGGTSSISSSSTINTNVSTMGTTDDAAMVREKIRQATLSRQQKASSN